MKSDPMHIDTRRVKIYGHDYRPSSGFRRLLGTVFSLLLHGQSYAGKPPEQRVIRKKEADF
jgi:hypothetical protein